MLCKEGEEEEEKDDDDEDEELRNYQFHKLEPSVVSAVERCCVCNKMLTNNLG